MQLLPIEGNTQKLDGGAMFGHAPKALWSRWATVDDDNRINMACRCLLMITDDGKKILFETGVGSFFPPRLKDRYGVVEDHHCLLDNLGKHGISHDEIDYVVLSHLHFDHAGGLLSSWQENRAPELLFDRATIITGKQQWQHALKPHLRDKASYMPEITNLLEQSGRLVLLDPSDKSPLPGVEFRYSDGHTPGMMLAEITTGDGPVLFAADLIPGQAWMHLPICMGYDRCAERLVDEKKAILEDLIERKGRVFFTHDETTTCAAVKRDERQRFYAEPVNL